MKKLLIFLIMLLNIALASALFTIDNSVITGGAGCSIFGCVMQGNIDMNGYILFNVTIVNASIHEFDPIFSAENASIWAAINNTNTLIFMINDSFYIALGNYYTKNQSDGLYYLLTNPSNYINESYADSLYYSISNPSGYVNSTQANNSYYPLNSNPAGYINNSVANTTYYPLNNNPAGYINSTTLDNVTNGTWVKRSGDSMYGDLNMSNKSIIGVDVLEVHNITGRSPILINSPILSNSSITADTFFGNINGQNGTIFGVSFINGTIVNLHVTGSDSTFDGGATFNGTVNASDFNLVGDNIYIYKDNLTFYFNGTLLNYTIENITRNITIENNFTLLLNSLSPYIPIQNGSPITNISLNESYLNNTINNISKIRTITYNMTCTASSGFCSITSGINITFEITEVKVIPTTSTNKYKFEMSEYPNTANIIDKDRAKHTGTWDIEKSYAINGQVQANITNADIDELFTISIIYLTNGVQ